MICSLAGSHAFGPSRETTNREMRLSLCSPAEFGPLLKT